MRTLLVDPAKKIAVEATIAGPDYVAPEGLVAVASDTANIGWVWDGTELFEPPIQPPTVAQLVAYAAAKQDPVLAKLEVSHALADGSTTLTTRCDEKSRGFLNSLAAWVLMNAAASPAPTRTYYNLDGSAHQVTPAEMGEFLSAVGAAEQSTFDKVAEITAAITATPSTIKTFADIDAAGWPTSVG